MFDSKAFDKLISTLERNSELAEDLLKALELYVGKERGEEILTADEALAFLKVSKSTLLNEEKAGKIVPARYGKKGIKRYKRIDLLAYLDSQKSKIEKRRKT